MWFFFSFYCDGFFSFLLLYCGKGLTNTEVLTLSLTSVKNVCPFCWKGNLHTEKSVSFLNTLLTNVKIVYEVVLKKIYLLLTD